MQALAFDLGGTHLRGAVVDRDGALNAPFRMRLPRMDAGCSNREIWATVVAAIIDYEKCNRELLPPAAPVVIAFPGPISGQRQILQAPTVSGSNAAPDLAAEIERATGRQAYLLNDVSAAAWHFAESTAATRFLVVTVSSGIGSKVFDRQHAKQVLDDAGFAGEIGHLVVDDTPDALRCDCGGKGHLGAIASGRGIERSARRRAERNIADFQRTLPGQAVAGDSSMLTNEAHLVPAALAGDPWTWGVIEDCTRPLARTLVSVILANGLDHVFVMGGFAQALGDAYRHLLVRLMIDMCDYEIARPSLSSMVTLGPSSEEPGLQGCGSFLRWKGMSLWS
jgi:predicted NBD/HSP70 family sugar kinase